MSPTSGKRVLGVRVIVIWLCILVVTTTPVIAAAFSPLLQWRDPVYQIAGFAGVIGLSIMLLQPILAAGYLPGLSGLRGRRVHRVAGSLLVVLVVVHVAGLWLTSPPDVVDVLLFRSPTPFSVWGVVAMWAVFVTACLAALRRRLPLRVWRFGHTGLIVVVTIGTVVHALLIEGTMETLSKIVICALVLAATGKAIADLRVWILLKRRRAR